MMRRCVLACLTSVILACLVWQTGHAIESSGVGLLPAMPRDDVARSSSIIIHTLAPGEQVDDAVTVANNSQTKKTIALYAADSQASSDGAFACAQQIEAPRKVGRWVAPVISQVTLAPGQTKKVTLHIAAPQQVEPGEYSGCIVVQEVNAPVQRQSNGVALQFRSALRVSLTIPGDLRAGIELTQLTTEALRQQMILHQTVKNTGNVTVDTTFEASLRGLLSGSSYTQTNGVYTVFPQVESVFNFEVDNPFWGGWYRAEVQARYYQVNSDGVRQSQKITHSATPTVVFVMPQPLALLIETVMLIVIVGGVIMGVRYIRRYVHDRRFTEAYTVVEGDTLHKIADRYDTSWRRIAARNRLRPPYALVAGSTLMIPTHTAYEQRTKR